MAKLIGPLHSAEARGRVSGLIYNTWRGIAYAKAFCAAAQPRSQRQLQIRAWSMEFVRTWGRLTQAQRDAWNAYAVAHPEIDWTGNPKRLTGLNWYLRCSVRLADMGAAIQPLPPITAAPGSPAAFVAADGVLQSVLTWTATGGTDMTLDAWIIGPHSAGILAKIERCKHEAYADGETGTETITGLFPGVYTIFARMIDEDNGLASTWVSDRAVITAV